MMRTLQRLPASSLLPAILTASLLCACTAPTRTEVHLDDTSQPLQPDQQAVVLFPTHRDGAAMHDRDFMNCLADELREQVENRVTIFDTATFQDALFPWFENEHAPSTIDELNALLARPFIRKRIASLGVRYLVNIAATASSDGFPGIFCGAGYGGGGCLGVLWEDKTNRANAVIWDLLLGLEPARLSASTSGRTVGFAFVVPILFVANTEKEACKALAAELGELLLTATPHE